MSPPVVPKPSPKSNPPFGVPKQRLTLRTLGCPKSLPAQSSRIPKPLPAPRTRPACRSAFPPAEELHNFAIDIMVLSPRPSPCDYQSELGTALAGAGRENPPAGQSVVRPRGGGAAADARRGRGSSLLSGSGGAGAGRGGGLAGGGSGRCGTVRTRRPGAGVAGESRRGWGAGLGFLR